MTYKSLLLKRTVRFVSCNLRTMSTVPHPATFIDATILGSLRAHAAEAEQLRHLHPAQLQRIYQERWFRMFVPSGYGGLQLSLPQVVRTEEALAWADGSTAWVVTLCSGAGWFAGFLNQDVVSKLFSDEKLCLAGSGAATGRAEVTDRGYVIEGEWKYASGALHATAFTANCVLTRQGVTLTDDAGKPRIKAFLFLPEEVALKKNWSSMGMVATASHGFSVTGTFVPENRSFVIDARHATLPDAVYRFPFLQLAEATLVVNISGMAQRFLDLIRETFQVRMDNQISSGINLHSLCEASHLRFQSARFRFYQALEEAWLLCQRAEEIPSRVLVEVSVSSHELYLTSLTEVQQLYRYGGLAVADPRSEINRVWRNLHTASQHSLFSTH